MVPSIDGGLQLLHVTDSAGLPSAQLGQCTVDATRTNQAANCRAPRIARQVEPDREIRGEATVVDPTGNQYSMSKNTANNEKSYVEPLHVGNCGETI